MSRRLAKIYKIKFREIEFEEHRITPRDCYTNAKNLLEIVEDNSYLVNEMKM